MAHPTTGKQAIPTTADSDTAPVAAIPDTFAAQRERGLTLKQARFCKAYMISGNATQAAIEAGYSEKTAYAIAEQNLRKIEIMKEIDRLTLVHEQAAQESAEARGISFTLEDIDREIIAAINMAREKEDSKALASLLTLAARRRGGLLDRSERKDTTDYGDALQEAISRGLRHQEIEAQRKKLADMHNGTADIPIREVGAA